MGASLAGPQSESRLKHEESAPRTTSAGSLISWAAGGKIVTDAARTHQAAPAGSAAKGRASAARAAQSPPKAVAPGATGRPSDINPHRHTVANCSAGKLGLGSHHRRVVLRNRRSPRHPTARLKVGERPASDAVCGAYGKFDPPIAIAQKARRPDLPDRSVRFHDPVADPIRQPTLREARGGRDGGGDDPNLQYSQGGKRGRRKNAHRTARGKWPGGFGRHCFARRRVPLESPKPRDADPLVQAESEAGRQYHTACRPKQTRSPAAGPGDRGGGRGGRGDRQKSQSRDHEDRGPPPTKADGLGQPEQEGRQSERGKRSPEQAGQIPTSTREDQNLVRADMGHAEQVEQMAG